MPTNYLMKNNFMQIWGKKILICILITVYLTVSVYPKRADAFFPAIAIGGAIEIGALAFWGGAALVASVGVAVGLDKELTDNIKDFGKSAWDGANDAIKSSITWATSKMTFGSTERYEVPITPEVKTYLETSFKNYWVNNPARPKLAINPVSKLVTTAAALTGFTTMASSAVNKSLGWHAMNGNIYNNVFKIVYLGSGQVQLSAQRTAGSTTSTITFTYPVNSLQEAYDYMIQNNILRPSVVGSGWTAETAPVLTNPLAPDVITVGDIPVGMPDVFTMPAPVAIPVSGQPDMIDLGIPVIGYPQGVIPAKPWDVAIGNPAIPGQAVKDLSPADTITSAPTISAPAVPANPSINWNDIPSDSLNFGPLKIAGYLFTTKFPFSIPWDIERQFAVFDVTPKPAILKVDKTIPLFGTSMKMKFEIDFTIMEPVAVVVRWFMIIAFDLGMILSIRKFMPE